VMNSEDPRIGPAGSDDVFDIKSSGICFGTSGISGNGAMLSGNRAALDFCGGSYGSAGLVPVMRKLLLERKLAERDTDGALDRWGEHLAT